MHEGTLTSLSGDVRHVEGGTDATRKARNPSLNWEECGGLGGGLGGDFTSMGFGLMFCGCAHT